MMRVLPGWAPYRPDPDGAWRGRNAHGACCYTRCRWKMGEWPVTASSLQPNGIFIPTGPWYGACGGWMRRAKQRCATAQRPWFRPSTLAWLMKSGFIMHEMSLAEGVLQVIEDYAKKEGYCRVKTVKLEIGRLSGAEPE